MADKVNNLQDVFLNTLRKSKTPVTMFLVKGVKLQGIITWPRSRRASPRSARRRCCRRYSSPPCAARTSR